MPTANEERVRASLRRTLERAVRYHGARPEYATVVQLNPVQAKRASDDAALIEGHDLLFSHAVKTYIADYGMAVDDTLVLHLMEDGNYVVIEVLHDRNVLPVGIGPPGPPGADAPPPEAAIAVQGGIGFQNGWVNRAGLFAPCSYYKDRGRVYIDGAAKDGDTSAGVIIFTLPAGYRPSATRLCLGFTDGSGGRPLQVEVRANGEVRLWDAGGGIGGTGVYFGVSFLL